MAAQAEADAAEAAEAKRREFRSMQLRHDKAVRAKAADFDQHVTKVHAAAQARHAAMHAEDVRIQQSLARKAAARKELVKAATALDVSRNIDAFEEKLARMAMGAGGPGNAGGGVAGADGASSPTIKASDILPPVGKTPYEHAQRIKQFLPDQERLKVEAEVSFVCFCFHAVAAACVQAAQLFMVTFMHPTCHVRSRTHSKLPCAADRNQGNGVLSLS